MLAINRPLVIDLKRVSGVSPGDNNVNQFRVRYRSPIRSFAIAQPILLSPSPTTSQPHSYPTTNTASVANNKTSGAECPQPTAVQLAVQRTMSKITGV